MLFGAHVSIAGSLSSAPARAKEIGAECFQIFSRSPHSGKIKDLSIDVVECFKKECQKFGFKEYYIHTPYFINLASNKNRIYYGSISAIRQELDRGSLLSAKYVMTHLGSAKDLGLKKSIELVGQGIDKILNDYKGKTQFLIELSAGAGQIIGDTFEEVSSVIKKVTTKNQKKVGICFDTCHAFASGYDLRTKESIKKVLDKFDKVIGLEKLKLIHANDSKGDLGSHLDRHENIGQGKIGLDGFEILVKEPRLRGINFIIETPPENDKQDLKILKKLRG